MTEAKVQRQGRGAEAPQQRCHELQAMARGYRQAQVLLTCAELGVFEALMDGAATAQRVADVVDADERGVELLLNAATALGLLAKRDDRFVSSPLVDACLEPGRESGLAHRLRLEGAFYRRWGHLAQAVRTGQRPEENRRDERPDDWVGTFVHGLYAAAKPVAPIVAEALDLPADRPLRLLDVGGGHGAYSMALARRYPRLQATVYELSRVVPVAREIIAAEELTERVTVQEGDFQQEELGEGYDVALVFGVLNGESPSRRPALIRKVVSALKPGGWIVLRDFVLDADRAGPPEAALFALQMLLATDSGGLDTREDWERWLAEAGFKAPRVVPLPPPVGGSLTIAERPVRGRSTQSRG